MLVVYLWGMDRGTEEEVVESPLEDSQLPVEEVSLGEVHRPVVFDWYALLVCGLCLVGLFCRCLSLKWKEQKVKTSEIFEGHNSTWCSERPFKGATDSLEDCIRWEQHKFW